MYGSYYVTIPCAAQSRGSIDGRGNASDGLRSITPCPTLHDPPLAKARGEFNMGHFSVEIYALPGSLLSSNQHSGQFHGAVDPLLNRIRSEEHTSELQSLMSNSYAVFCLDKKTYIDIDLTQVIEIN